MTTHFYIFVLFSDDTESFQTFVIFGVIMMTIFTLITILIIFGESHVCSVYLAITR